MSHSILHRISFLLYPGQANSSWWRCRLFGSCVSSCPRCISGLWGFSRWLAFPSISSCSARCARRKRPTFWRERVRMLEEQERVQVAYREQIAADMEDIMKLQPRGGRRRWTRRCDACASKRRGAPRSGFRALSTSWARRPFACASIARPMRWRR